MKEIPMSTQVAQNQLSRISRTIMLPVDDPTLKQKKAFAKVQKAIIDLDTSLDAMNDLIEESL